MSRSGTPDTFMSMHSRSAVAVSLLTKRYTLNFASSSSSSSPTVHEGTRSSYDSVPAQMVSAQLFSSTTELKKVSSNALVPIFSPIFSNRRVMNARKYRNGVMPYPSGTCSALSPDDMTLAIHFSSCGEVSLVCSGSFNMM